MVRRAGSFQLLKINNLYSMKQQEIMKTVEELQDDHDALQEYINEEENEDIRRELRKRMNDVCADIARQVIDIGV